MTTMTAENETTYNGWKNYETWDVALWIGNDEGLYGIARSIASMGGGYNAFGLYMRDQGMTETPDGVAWNDSGLDIEALDDMMAELNS